MSLPTHKSYNHTARLLLGLLLLPGLVEASLLFSYDFNALSVGDTFTASDPKLQGQDGWIGTLNRVTIVNSGDPRVYAPGASFDDQSWRTNQVGDDFGDRTATALGDAFGLTNAGAFSMKMRARVRGDRNARTTFALGYDAANSGAQGTISVQFGVAQNNYFIRNAGFGSTTSVAHGLSGDNHRWLRLDIDPLNGLTSLFTSTDDMTYTPVVGLQNIDASLASGPNPSELNGVYVRLFGANSGSFADDLSVASAVPEPSVAVLLLFGGLGLLRLSRKS